MKLSNGQILNALSVLRNIKERKSQMPIALAFNLLKNIKVLENEIETYQEVYDSLLNKYAIKNDDGSFSTDEYGIKFNDGNKELFIKEYNELLNVKIDIDINPIDITLCEKLNVSLEEMINIDFMFIDKNEK